MPTAGSGSPHTNSPELPTSFLFTCIQSISSTKFSYCFSVRRKPVGLPVVTISPSFTKNVSGWQFTFTQPVEVLAVEQRREAVVGRLRQRERLRLVLGRQRRGESRASERDGEQAERGDIDVTPW